MRILIRCASSNLPRASNQAIRSVSSSRIVSAAGEDSEEQAARRAAIALAERLGIDVTYLPGAHGGWGSDPQAFADSLDKVLQAD